MAWENDFKIDVSETGFEYVNFIERVHDRIL
jgi:hypothetical protein